MARTGYRGDTRHLGTVVGDPDRPRIIAVSTSGVFHDDTLVRTFWGTDPSAIDSGIQGHLYAGPDDIFVVRIPEGTGPSINLLASALDANADIWAALTGIRLATSRSRIVLASDRARVTSLALPGTMSWHVGTLTDAAAAQYTAGHGSLLAFVLDETTLRPLGPAHDRLTQQARTTSMLMDKNRAMEILQRNAVPSAQTFALTSGADLARSLREIPRVGRYVFKPAGGAAGIGVYRGAGTGASAGEIGRHVHGLARSGRLPRRFQVQRFLAGIPHGVSAHIGGDGSVVVLEAHRQVIDPAGRCMGARWTSAIEWSQQKSAAAIYSRIVAIPGLHPSGLVCLDLIDGRVIEVNPRLTASAPIAHLLHREAQMATHRGSEFTISQIDVHTSVSVPAASMIDGRLRALVDRILTDYGVLALPQGLNPFGPSRFAFVNDDSAGTAQRLFLRQVDGLRHASGAGNGS